MTSYPKTDHIESDEFVRHEPYGSKSRESFVSLIKYFILGSAFGIVFVKSEIISWFRIQEMFRFDSFHMYGIIGSAVLTGMISIQLIKRLRIPTLGGDTILIAPKIFHKGLIYGGLLFGIGWAITGACPGPLFAQIGGGYAAVSVTLLSALAGTWCYGSLRHRLPH